MSGTEEPVKLMLLAIGLGVGGTESHVLELASRLDRKRFQVTVCTLRGDGAIARELRNRGVRVVALGGRGKLDACVLVRLWRLIRRERPAVIHAFLFWANLAGRSRRINRSEEHTSELQSHSDLVCRRLLEKKNKPARTTSTDSAAPGCTSER